MFTKLTHLFLYLKKTQKKTGLCHIGYQPPVDILDWVIMIYLKYQLHGNNTYIKYSQIANLCAFLTTKFMNKIFSGQGLSTFESYWKSMEFQIPIFKTWKTMEKQVGFVDFLCSIYTKLSSLHPRTWIKTC